MEGNHSQKDLGPIALMCMDSDAKDLMLKAEKGYEKHVREIGLRQSVPGFIDWLFKSGLVDDVREKAVIEFEKHRQKILESFQGSPNTEFTRSAKRRSIHSFAYWFFRWSGLVDAAGKAVIK